MSLYVPSAFKLTGSSSLQLNGVHDIEEDNAIKVMEAYAAGAVEPSHQSVIEQMPKLTFSVFELASALSAIGLGGVKIPNSTVITGWEQYFAQLDNAGDRVSGSNHGKLAGVSGILVVTEISAKQGQLAQLKCLLQLTYDGTNAPWTASTGVALLSSVYITEAFTLGPVYINSGTALTPELVQGVTISTGITVETKSGSGEVFPRRCHVKQRRPKITIDSDRWTDFSTLGISGTAQGATASRVFFRKLTNDGTRVADGTAEHVLCTVTASQGIIYPQAKKSSGANEVNSGSIVIDARAGASVSIAFNTASAIS